MFFSREKEIQDMNELFSAPKRAVLLYGKRRVGKTELITHVLKGRKSIYYECVKDTIEENVRLFANECKKAGIAIPDYAKFTSFIDVFGFLNSLNEHYLIAIDEYPYLKAMSDPFAVDSMFQNIIDHQITNLGLIISGSAMRIMKDLLTEGNPLFGRFNLTIKLPEFNYLEAAQFYPRLSNYDKVAMYAVFGGSPFVNKEINPDLSLKENVAKTFLKEGSEVYNYADNMLLSDAANEIQARRLLSALANSKKKYAELTAMLDKEKTGVFARSLNSLQDLEIVAKYYPINRINDAKKTMYEISDNAVRFFFTYVYKNKAQLNILGPNAFYDEYIEPTLTEYISHRFESLARDYFSLCVKNGSLTGVQNIGTYYYDDPTNKKNGEFDVALQKKNGFEIYEVKYLQSEMTRQQISEEVEQIKGIREIGITHIGFVSIHGFAEDVTGYTLLTGEDIYFKRLVA